MKDKERLIDRILNHKMTVGKIEFSCFDLFFVMILWGFAFILRYKLFPIRSGDYIGFLEPWMEKIKELGAWKSLGERVSNYSSPYMYLMCLVSAFDNTLISLKLVSVFFDYLASVAVFMIIHLLTENTQKSILAMSLLLLCPAVVMNSAYWCQCDVIYSCFLLFALYFFFKDNSRMCFIMIGISFSFKLQTLFILPFFVIMWLLKKTVKIRHVLYIPLVYFIMHIPAMMAGRSFKDIMTIYFEQANTYSWGTLEYPNIYAVLDETIYNSHYSEELSNAGIFMTFMVLAFLAYYIYSSLGTGLFNFDKLSEVSISKMDFTNFAVSLALFSMGISIYCLPHMHDRYGFMFDLLVIIYAMLRPKKLPVLAAVFMVTIIIYLKFLIGVYILELSHTALIQFAILIYLGKDLYMQITNLRLAKS